MNTSTNIHNNLTSYLKMLFQIPNQPITTQIQNPVFVEQAYNRIKDYIIKTPIFTSEVINNITRHHFFFKMDAMQHSRAFKIRGILNHLLELRGKGMMPAKVVAYSTGNHGIGLSLVASWFKIQAKIYMPMHTSQHKQNLISNNGAELILTETRQESEDSTKYDALHNDFYYMHPSDSDATIAGVGTLCYEALTQLVEKPDAIFAACGGGGLLSGTYLAKELLAPQSLVFGSEPTLANDAYISKQNGSIFRFKDSPLTIADGLKALSLSQRTFEYIKKLDGIYLINEQEILLWTTKLTQELQTPIEPSAALNVPAAIEWLATQREERKVLVLISGGNC